MSAQMIRAAAAQLSPVLGSREGTIAKVIDAIAAAASQGAQLIVFPETVVPYYPYFSFITPAVAMGPAHLALYDQAVTVPSADTERVGAAARQYRIVVVLGVNERDHGSLYNTQLIFDADGVLQFVQRRKRSSMADRAFNAVWLFQIADA